MFYKIFTHDFCSPIQGGEPVWDGTLPFTTPEVKLDTSQDKCAAGWNFVDDLSEGLKISGLWPNGYPSLAYEVQPADDVIQRGTKWRASQITVQRQVSQQEIDAAIRSLSAVFTPYSEDMLAEQIAWRTALSRPEHDEGKVVSGLESAIAERKLNLKIQRYENVRAAWDARAARDARDAWDTWAARDARAAWATWAAWDVRDARDAWDTWAARDAWDAWDARVAWDVRAALTVYFAAKNGWIKVYPMLLTTGIRDAHQNGMVMALPTNPGELGYSMVKIGIGG